MANHLIIGLGGTGGSIIRALRKRIYEEFRSNTPNGSAHIEYLYVDSSLADLNNEEDWQTLGASVQLDPAQRLSINGIPSEVLSHLEMYPGIHSFINEKDETMLKEGIGAIIGAGIGGQRRRFGRMLIANNMRGLPQNTFVGQVHSRVRALKEIEDVNDVTFHICSGLGGGTGSGSIIDAITQLRNEFQRTGGDRDIYKIQLYLYVPEKIIQIPGGEDSNRYYQPNGYAALLELNAMSVGRYYPTDVKGNTDEDGSVRRLLSNQDAFDMAYLFTNVNEAGKEVHLHKVLPDIVGDFLFQKIIASSIGNGKMARLETAENNGLLPEQNELGESVHSRRFMTFGVKRIEYPETEVEEFGAYNYARQASLQMLYGLWDDARGFLDECTEDMVGKSYKQDVVKPDELENNLLADSYLMLDKPLPSIEKHVSWKPIIEGWEIYTDRYKQDAQNDYEKKEWLEEFNGLCDRFYSTMYRGSGVRKFYQDYSNEIAGFAEEICRKIENNLFVKWKNGVMSIIEVKKYLSVLITSCEERIKDFNSKKGKREAFLNEELAQSIKEIRHTWNTIGWIADAITNASAKTFGRFVDAKREQLTLMTQIEGYNFAEKLLEEVKNQLSLLNLNSVEPFMKVLSEYAVAMKRQAEEKCKLSDSEIVNMQGEVIKEYDPKMVRTTVTGFLKNEKNQKVYATGLRQRIIDAVGASEVTFSLLSKKINAGRLLNITLKACVENARKDMDDYSKKNPNQRLVNVNILDKLHNTECSTPEKMRKFVKSIYDAAQSYLTFNNSEEGQGSPETAANHQKIIQLSLPQYKDDDQFRNDFIRAFGNSGTIPFDKDEDSSENFRANQIVVVTAHSGFPLRYVDNVMLLRDKYNVLTRNEVNKMVVHTESFRNPLPYLYGMNKEDNRKNLIPIVLLAYSLDGIIVRREDAETGEVINAFAGEKNKMGKVSRWIKVGDNILDTVNKLCEPTKVADAAILKKVLQEELDVNYKHIEKKKALMLKMGETIDNLVLPLVKSENNKDYLDFNKAGEKLCDNDLRLN